MFCHFHYNPWNSVFRRNLYNSVGRTNRGGVGALASASCQNEEKCAARWFLNNDNEAQWPNLNNWRSPSQVDRMSSRLTRAIRRRRSDALSCVDQGGGHIRPSVWQVDVEFYRFLYLLFHLYEEIRIFFLCYKKQTDYKTIPSFSPFNTVPNWGILIHLFMMKHVLCPT